MVQWTIPDWLHPRQPLMLLGSWRALFCYKWIHLFKWYSMNFSFEYIFLKEHFHSCFTFCIWYHTCYKTCRYDLWSLQKRESWRWLPVGSGVETESCQSESMGDNSANILQSQALTQTQTGSIPLKIKILIGVIFIVTEISSMFICKSLIYKVFAIIYKTSSLHLM